MTDQVIICPHCGGKIPLTEAISHPIKKSLKKEMEVELKKKTDERAALEMKDLHEQIAEKDKKLKESQETELELRKKKRELEESKKNIELELARKLDTEKEKLEEVITKRLAEEHRKVVSMFNILRFCDTHNHLTL